MKWGIVLHFSFMLRIGTLNCFYWLLHWGEFSILAQLVPNEADQLALGRGPCAQARLACVPEASCHCSKWGSIWHHGEGRGTCYSELMQSLSETHTNTSSLLTHQPDTSHYHRVLVDFMPGRRTLTPMSEITEVPQRSYFKSPSCFFKAFKLTLNQHQNRSFTLEQIGMEKCLLIH